MARPQAGAPTPTPSQGQVDPYAGLDHTGTPSLPPRMDRPQLAGTKGARGGKKRRLPNYDGRPPARLTAGEVLVWVPRVLFFPVYLTLEYLVRWPIVKLVTVLERYHVINRLTNLFTLGGTKALLLPTIFVDFSRFASVGFYFHYKDLGVENHNLTVQAGIWTGDWYHAVVTDSFKIFAKDQGTVKLRAEFFWRPDHVFHGLGPDTRQSDESFFRQRRTEVALSLKAKLWDLNRVFFEVQYRNVKIEAGQDRPIDAPDLPWAVGDPGAVPGYGETYNLLTAKMKLDLDSRNPERGATPGSGLRFEASGSYSVDPGNTALHFARWGGELAGFWDITGNNHVLALRLCVAGLERVGDAPVPITERLLVGGSPERMPGFLEGRFRGDSMLLFTAQYRYPIWSMLDASLFVSVGNVFNGRFDDFAFRRMVMSWGIALRTNTSRDVSFDLLLAFGTNQLEHWRGDFAVDFIRVTAGINQGF